MQPQSARYSPLVYIFHGDAGRIKRNPGGMVDRIKSFSWIDWNSTSYLSVIEVIQYLLSKMCQCNWAESLSSLALIPSRPVALLVLNLYTQFLQHTHCVNFFEIKGMG